MSISEISRTGNPSGFMNPGQRQAANASGERQNVSLSGNVSPPAGQNVEQTQKQVAPSPEATEKALAILEDFFTSHSRNLQFAVDESSGKEIITVLDGETGEVIRQFPAEEIVASARYIAASNQDAATGVLLNQQS